MPAISPDERKRRKDTFKLDHGEETVDSTALTSADNAHLTDTGNAERLVAEHGRNIRYCWSWHKWVAWTGRHWEVDADAKVLQLAKRTVQTMYRRAAKIDDDDEREKAAKHALGSESRSRREAMVVLAQSEQLVAVEHDVFDRDTWLLNCMNGTLDLRTAELDNHDRLDYITKLAPVRFDSGATCPRWLQFLEEVFEGNTELIQFVERAAGYSLTGDVSEDALFFLHGTGANGKTTLFLTLQKLLGPYAIQVSPGLLLSQYHEPHSTGLMDLFGVRLAASVEVGEGRRFDEERLKQITGGDIIRGRRMREDFWQFEPTHKIWLAANEKPRVQGVDYALWRRIKLIPFDVKFTEPGESGPDRDPSLRKDLFCDERPGILNWCLEGCLSWQAEGLLPPPEVKTAVAQYQAEEDVVQQFIEAECAVGSDLKANPTQLHKAYERWRKATGAAKMTGNAFGRRLTDKGFGIYHDGNKRWRIGLAASEQTKMDWGNSETNAL